MVLPSHIPPLAWGQACALGRGRSFLVPRGAHTLCKGNSPCPDKTRREDPPMVLPSHIPLLEGTEELCGGRGRAAGPAAEPPKRTGGSLARRYGGRPAARMPAPCRGQRGLTFGGGRLVRFWLFCAGTPFSAKILIFCCISGVISVI